MRRLPPLGAIEAFVQVARLGSVKAAAQELALSAPALSRRVQSLERFIGKPLFDRRHQAMTPNADGDRLLVFASKAGAPTNPDWYHNLVANPTATVDVGDESFTVKATVLTGAERDRLYAKQAELYPGFAEYQEKTTRTIPVVALERIPEA